MRIHWVSNAPWAKTGYGNQTRLFLQRIKKLGHDVSMTCFYGLEGGVLNLDGIPIYPKGHMTYGQDIMSANAAHFKADLLITLVDAWVMEPAMMAHGTRWSPWFPVDMDPLPPPVKRKIESAYARIVYSRYAEQKCNEAGLDCLYVPHGVDANTYKPGDQAEARKKLGVPNDVFVVGMVAANKGTPSRKALPQSIEAFANFHKARPDTLLYLHTSKSEGGEYGGVNLPELVRYLNIQDCVVFADPHTLMLGYPDEHMVNIYNAMDVLLAASMGEGFGIPILEAQACGKPVIVGDWTSMSELCFSGWKIPLRGGADKWWTPLGAYQFLPRIGALEQMLMRAYKHAHDTGMAEAARAGALAYDADRVTSEFWQPVLAKLENDIKSTTGKLELVRF